jgi:hypothetical protein
MHFGRVKFGDHYSVSPDATLGPTQGTRAEWAERLLVNYAASNQLASKMERRREFDRSWVCNWATVIPTVKSEINKESKNWAAESVIL